MGGVKCDRCRNLHAVITSIFASSENLHPDIKEGTYSSVCTICIQTLKTSDYYTTYMDLYGLVCWYYSWKATGKL